MHKFSQGDLVTIHVDTIPNTDAPVKKMFPLGIGVVAYTTSPRDNVDIYGQPDDFEFVHLIPVAKIQANRMTQEEHTKWIRRKFTTTHGRLTARKEKDRESSWFFYDKNLRIFQFSDSKYFDDDVFRMD